MDQVATSYDFSSLYHLIADFGARAELPTEHYQYLVKLLNDMDYYKRRYPVTIALLVSPICVLVDKKLTSRTMGQDCLLNVSYLHETHSVCC